MKLHELEDADTLLSALQRLEDRMSKLEDRFDNWLRWIIGLQLGLYAVIIGAFFIHR